MVEVHGLGAQAIRLQHALASAHEGCRSKSVPLHALLVLPYSFLLPSTPA